MKVGIEMEEAIKKHGKVTQLPKEFKDEFHEKIDAARARVAARSATSAWEHYDHTNIQTCSLIEDHNKVSHCSLSLKLSFTLSLYILSCIYLNMVYM